MPSKPIWIDKFDELSIYSFPFRISNILILFLFTLTFSYVLGATLFLGMIGFIVTITLAYVSFSFFFGYLFVIFEYTSLGFQEIPRLSADLLFNERGRLVKATVLVSFFLSAIFFVTDPFWQTFLTITSLLLIPVAMSVLIMEGRLISALNPLNWFAALKNIEADARFGQFLILQFSMLLTGYVALFVNLGWFNILTMMAFLTVSMTAFRCLGVVLHSNAESLGLEVVYGPVIEEEQTQRARDQELSEFTASLYSLSGAGKTEKAREMLNQRLEDDGYITEPDLFGRIRGWENPALAISAGRGFLDRLVAAQDIRTSWHVLEFCFEANHNQYKLTSANSVITLAGLAETFKQKTIMAHLLEHFEEDFPNHPKTAEMLLLAAHFIAHDLDDFEKARGIMARLESDFPKIHADKTYQALHTILFQPD
ncbi:MAG: hypothetical protein ABGY96_18635 [bacterium]|nr:hypothetical protein [Gammaproteobacteria bacterium]HIL98855.1 hypothetical protein [Pseudomonadales bacterium]